MNPHPVRSQDSLPVPEKNPSTLGNPSRNPRPANSRKDDHIKTLTESKFRRVATCTPFGGSCCSLATCLKVGNPFWGGSFWMKNWRPCSFFCVFWGIQMKRWNSRTTSRACKRESSFLIYMHCAWHCRTYTCTHFCKQKRGGDVWVKCRNNCRQGHVTLSLLDTIVLSRYVGSSCSSLKCVNFAPWRNCT